MLTKRQRDCLVFLQNYKRKNPTGSPSYEMIAEGLRLASKASVHRLVHGLIERGFVLQGRQGQEIHILRTATGGKAPPPPGRIPIYRSGDLKLMGYLP